MKVDSHGVGASAQNQAQAAYRSHLFLACIAKALLKRIQLSFLFMVTIQADRIAGYLKPIYAADNVCLGEKNCSKEWLQLVLSPRWDELSQAIPDSSPVGRFWRERTGSKAQLISQRHRSSFWLSTETEGLMEVVLVRSLTGFKKNLVNDLRNRAWFLGDPMWRQELDLMMFGSLPTQDSLQLYEYLCALHFIVL